jgi:hypothetical protein
MAASAPFFAALEFVRVVVLGYAMSEAARPMYADGARRPM